MLHLIRWVWPLVFLVPLTLFSERGCRFPGVDPAYHSMLWMHENLPALLLVAALFAAVAVTVRVAYARARASALFVLATPPPAKVTSAFVSEAARLGVALPQLAYLDVAAPLCFALFGRLSSVVISRGFAENLDHDELAMVARHELLHVKHRDPIRGFAWHVAFAALLMPWFTALEAWLASRRELRTNLESAALEPDRYASLLVSRARERRGVCIGAFGAPARSRGIVFAVAPAACSVVVVGALAFSHAWFLNHLAFLSTHHC